MTKDSHIKCAALYLFASFCCFLSLSIGAFILILFPALLFLGLGVMNVIQALASDTAQKESQ